MKHETFRDAAVGEAFEVIEGRLLPSLTFLIDQASAAEPGVSAGAAADELRRLARDLEALQALFNLAARSHSPPEMICQFDSD